MFTQLLNMQNCSLPMDCTKTDRDLIWTEELTLQAHPLNKDSVF